MHQHQERFALFRATLCHVVFDYFYKYTGKLNNKLLLRLVYYYITVMVACFGQIISIKVARSDFWITIPFNFHQLLYHHHKSVRKSIVIAELEKDQSFR